MGEGEKLSLIIKQSAVICKFMTNKMTGVQLLPINIDQNKINDFCQRNFIHKLSLFGSVLRDDFNQDSDVDFLVWFEQGKTPGYLRLTSMEIELSAMINRQADLRTPAELSRYFRDKVLQEAVTIYVNN